MTVGIGIKGFVFSVLFSDLPAAIQEPVRPCLHKRHDEIQKVRILNCLMFTYKS